MSSIDERIVEMRFDNKDFENNVQQTMTTLDKLKSALNFKDASKSFENITAAANNVSLESIGESLAAIESRFSTFGIVGMNVISNLTNSAMGMLRKLGGVVNDSIIGGGIRRATNIEKARFTMQGLFKDTEKVNEVMNDVKWSVDGTAYSLDAAATVASTLVTSGVEAGDSMKHALRGAAGIAAVTNSSYEDIGRLYMKIATNNKIMGEEIQSFSARGLPIIDLFVEKTGKSAEQVRKMMQNGAIDFDTFSEYMFQKFGDHAAAANETLWGVASNVKSALARIGELFVAPLVVQNSELVYLLNTVRLKINEIKNNLGPVADLFVRIVKSLAVTADYYIDKMDIGTRLKDRFRMLNAWNKNTYFGYSVFAEGMSYFLEAILQRLGAIRDAFDSVFGRGGGFASFLSRSTRNFRDFTQSLLLTEDQIDGLRFILTAVFKVIKFGINIVKGIIKIVFKPLSLIIGLVEILEHVFLSVVGAISHFYYNITGAIKNSNAFKKVVTSVKDALYRVRKAFDFTAKGGELFSKIWEKLTGIFEFISEPIQQALRGIDVLGAVSAAAEKIFGGFVYVISSVKDGILEFVDAFKKTEFAQMIEGWASSIEEFWGKLDVGKVASGYLEKFVSWLNNLSEKKIVLPEVNMEGIAKQISDFLISVGNTLETIGTWISIHMQPVIDFFKKVGKKITELFSVLTGPNEGKAQRLLDYFKNLGTSISNFYKKIKDSAIAKIKELWANLKDPSFSLKQAIENVKNYIKAFVGEETYQKFENFITLLKDFKDNVLGALTGKSEDAGSKLEEFAQKVKDFIASIDIDPKTVIAIGLLVLLATFVRNISKILGHVNGLMDSLKGLITTLKTKVAGVLAQNTKVLQVAIMIGVLAGSLKMLSKIPAKKLRSTVLWFAASIGILVGAFVALQFLTKLIDKKFKGKGPQLEETVKSLLVFVGTIFLVMLAIKAASSLVVSDNLAASIGLIVVIMGILIGAAFALQKIKMNKRAIFGMAALALFALSIGKVFNALNKLTKNVEDPGKLAGIVWALFPVMIGLGVLAFGAGQVSLPSAVALLALVKMLEVVLPMLSGLTDEDVGKIQQFVKENTLLFLALAALGLVMVGISAKFGKNIKGAGIGIAAIGAAFLIIAFAIERLGGIDRAKLEQGLSTIAILTLIILLLEAVSFATRFNAFPKFAKGMLMVSGVFLVFALIMKIMGKLDDAAIMKGIIVIVTFGIMLAILMAVSGLTKKVKTGPIIAIAATLVVLGGILIALSLIPWDDLKHACAAFAIVLAVLGFAFGRIFGSLKKLTKSNAIGLLFMLGMIGTIWLIGHVLEKLASLDWLNLLIAGISMALCLGVFAVAVSSVVDLAKAAGKSNKAGIGYLGVMIGVIAAIGASLWLISRNPWQSILAAGAVMTASLWMLTKTLKPITELASVKKLNKQGIGYLGVMCGVIIALGVAMAIMATQPWPNVLMAGVAMALALASFGVCCKLLTDLATANQVNLKSLVYVVAMIFVMGVIAAAMYILADKPWQGLIAAGAGMALVLAGLAACIGVLSLIKGSGPQILTAAASVIVLSLALIAIGYAMSFVAGFPADQIIATTIAFISIIVTLSVVIAVLGNVGWVAGAAAAANLIEFVGLLSAGIIALAELWDAVKESLGGTEAVLSKIEALGLIFEAVGAAIGKIITGFLNSIGQGVEEMASHMPAVGNYLGQFMTKMSSVYAMAGTQKDDKIEKFDKIIASVTGLNKFSVSLEDIEKFSNCAVPFGEAIKSYVESIKNITGDDIDKADMAASITEKIVALNDKLPSEGGWLDKIFGVKDLAGFGNQMKGFGEAIVSFCTSIAFLTNADKLHADYAEKVATPILNIAANLSRKGGLIEGLLGKQWTLEEFGDQMNKFADCVISFSAKIKDFTDCSEQATALRDSATPMFEFAGELQRNGGIIDAIIGKKMSLSEFGSHLTNFASYLISYCYKINKKEIDTARMDEVTYALTRLSNMLTAISGWDSNNLSVFDSAIKTIGSISIDAVISDLESYSSALTSKLDEIFGGAASHIETVNQPDMVDKAKGIVDAMVEGINSSECTRNMTSAISTLMTNSKTGFNSATSDGYTAGKNFIQGFINGLRGTAQYASTAVYSIGRSLFYDFKNALGEKSPSKLTQEAGEFFVQGFINGLSDMESGAKKKVKSIASGTVGLLNDAISKAADYIGENMDASPVIRPVLDLTDVRYGTGLMQGMFSGYSMNFAASTSGSVMAEQESQTRLNDLQMRLDAAIEKIGEIIQNESDRAENTNYMFEIPFAIDGRELARASATYNQEELNRLTRNIQRKEGHR